jgi:HJR/Mrr/RecB family endonuclease
LTSNAFILLARVLISGREYAKARLELQQVLKRWVTDEELSEAKFLLGKCYEYENEFEKAKEAYIEAQRMTQNTEIKEQSRIHGEYCSARATWPTLSLGKKIIWWITGRKPDEDVLVQLQFADERILTSIHHSILSKVDFSLPTPVDYESLAKFSKDAQTRTEALDGERLKIEKWAQDQTLRLQELLSAGNLSECTNIANRIVQRLSDSATPAPPSVLEALEKLNKELGIQTDQLRNKITYTEARQFEYEIARLLKLMGYEVHVTEATGDDGIDVFAQKDSEKVIVQCKKWKSKPVGRAVIDELAGTAARHKTTRAILATTSSFSHDAEQTAREHNIELWDFFMLCRFFQKFGQTLK